MTWVKFDDQLPNNRRWKRLVRKDPSAACLWVAGICWSSQHLTDGRIPKDELAEVVPVTKLDVRAGVLVTDGAWVDDGDAWVIHDYHEYQPSAAEVIARKEAERERKAKARQKGAANAGRSTNGQFQSNGVPPPVRPDDHPDDHPDDLWDDHPDDPWESQGVSPATRPVPSDKSTPLPPDGGADGFDEFWNAYPRRDGKKLEKAKAVAAWGRLTKPQRDDVMAGVGHYAKACNTGVTKAKDAFRWLRDRSWVDWQEPARPSNPTSYDVPTTSYDVPPTRYT